METRRDDVAEGASGPMDWRPNALFVAPSEMRATDGFDSAVERALSCEDEMGPSVVRRMAAAAVGKRAGQEERRDASRTIGLVLSNGLLVKRSAKETLLTLSTLFKTYKLGRQNVWLGKCCLNEQLFNPFITGLQILCLFEHLNI